MRFREIQSLEDLISLVDEIGFLPFFENRIPGYSLEEIISWDCWYQGRWEGKIHWPRYEHLDGNEPKAKMASYVRSMSAPLMRASGSEARI